MMLPFILVAVSCLSSVFVKSSHKRRFAFVFLSCLGPLSLFGGLCFAFGPRRSLLVSALPLSCGRFAGNSVWSFFFIAVSLLLDDSSFYCWLDFHWILRCFHGDFLNFIGCFISWTNYLLLRAGILYLRLLRHLWLQLFIYWPDVSLDPLSAWCFSRPSGLAL